MTGRLAGRMSWPGGSVTHPVKVCGAGSMVGVSSGGAARGENAADVLGFLFAVTLDDGVHLSQVGWRGKARKLALEGSPRFLGRSPLGPCRAAALSLSGTE